MYILIFIVMNTFSITTKYFFIFIHASISKSSNTISMHQHLPIPFSRVPIYSKKYQTSRCYKWKLYRYIQVSTCYPYALAQYAELSIYQMGARWKYSTSKMWLCYLPSEKIQRYTRHSQFSWSIADAFHTLCILGEYLIREHHLNRRVVTFRPLKKSNEQFFELSYSGWSSALWWERFHL